MYYLTLPKNHQARNWLIGPTVKSTFRVCKEIEEISQMFIAWQIAV